MNIFNWKLFATLVKNIGSEALNRNLIGFSLEDETEPVRLEDIISFADATRDDNPVYRDDNPVAPPLFISKLMLPMVKKIWVNKDLKLNILRMVHAQQEISWYGTIKIGERLKMRLTINDIRDTPAGELLEISGKFYSNDELTTEAKTGIIVRRKRKRPEKKNAEPELLKEEFRIEIQTAEGQQLKYAEASGDKNFIHTNSFLAKLAGLPRTIMHGACVMAMCCSTLAKIAVLNDITRLSGMKVRFSQPVIPGQTLTLIGHEAPVDGEIPFEVLNPAGKQVIKNGIFRFN